jgi:hypothetical protein
MPLGAFRLNGLGKFTVTASAEVIRAKKPVGAFGNTQVSTAQSKFGGASALFDGTGDRLIVANNDLLYWNTQPYTVEYWCRITAFATSQAFDDPTIIGNMNPDGNDDNWSFGPDNSGNLTFKYWNGANNTVKDTGTMSTGVWYHCAAVIASNTIKIYLDGVEKASAAISGTPQFSTAWGGLNIGWGRSSANMSYNGYLDEVRISNTARYTGNFTPSTTPFVNDTNTLLLLHMDGANTSTLFEDDNGNRLQKQIIPNGNAQISTAQSKFSGASAVFDGTDDWLQIETNSDFAFGTNDFTVEAWVRITGDSTANAGGTRYASIMSNAPAGTANNIWELAINGNTTTTGTGLTLVAYVGTGYGDISVSYTFNKNQWYHIAAVRNSGTVAFYVDGTVVGTPGSFTRSMSSPNPMRIGGQAATGYRHQLIGFIDELRVSNTARYTGNFTPSTTPFVNDTNTLLLLHMDGTNATAFFDDDNGRRSSIAITANGVAQIRTAQSKFGGSSLYTPSSGGANDNLSLPFITDLLWSESTNYTMECWTYHTAWPTSAGFPTVGTGEGSAVTFVLARNTGFVRWCFGFNATGKLTFDYNTSGGFGGITTQEATASGSLNTWQHIALVKQGTSVKGYVNGVEKISTTISGTVSIGTGTEVPRIGGHYWSTACFYDEVRFSNTARYTTTFTPSTTRFDDDEDTVLLIHADEVNGCRVFRDDNGKNLSPVPVVATITAPANTTSTASTITIPSTASAGDIAVLFDTSTTTTDTTPSGWTSITKSTTTGIRQNVSYKILSATDPNTSITGMAGTTRKVMVVYRGNTLITNVFPTVIGSQATTATPTNQSLTGEAGPMIAFAVYSATGAISTRGWSAGSPTEYSSVSTSGIYVKALITNSGTPSTTTISMTDSGTNALQSFRLKLI